MIVHSVIGTNKDPFLKYGTETAVGLFDRVRALRPELRSIALKQILDRVDPALWEKVSRNATALQKAGRSPDPQPVLPPRSYGVSGLGAPI